MTTFTFDKQLELRNVADGAETATAAETGLSLPVRMAGDFKAVFNVTALDTTSGNETDARCESYVTRADGDAYFADRLYMADWTDAE